MKHDRKPLRPDQADVLADPIVRTLHRQLASEQALRSRMVDDWLVGQMAMLA